MLFRSSLFIAPRRGCCGILCFRCLGLIGSFRLRLETLYLVGPLPLWTRSVERLGGQLPFYLFWTIWKERNRIVFYNEALSIQRLKISFVCNIFSWSKTCLDGEPRSLINFVNWLGSNGGLVSVCFFVFFVVGLFVYAPCMLRVAFLLPSFNKIFCVYLSKIKNKGVFVCPISIFVCFSLFKRGLGSGLVGWSRERGQWNFYLSRNHND